METHEQHQASNNNDSWLQRHKWITYIALGILGYFLFIEHRQHILPFLPYLFLLACPLMHLFMHGGQKHHDHSSHSKKER
jgi:hypothetical protein